MLYFYKETEKAMLFTTKEIGATKAVKLPNGNTVNVKVQVDDVKFAMVSKGEEDWGTLKAGDAVALVCSDSIVIDKDGEPCENLYWATIK
jgi:hypothetical protein